MSCVDRCSRFARSLEITYTNTVTASPPPPDQHESDSPDVTRLLHDVQQRAPGAADQLAIAVYRELHELAAHYMRGERSDHTLQPTALVHDAFMRLIDQRNVSWQNRAHFYGIAAQSMRRILVDHARRKHSAKRDGGERVTLDHSVAESADQSIDLLALNEALDRLGALDDRQARVVELRFFGGLSIGDTAEALNVSVATVNRDWTLARAFLRREMDAAS